MGISLLVRLFLASTIELGNDEVYYTLYAHYLDWSFFDHPPFVGISIRLSTLFGLLNTELFVRLTGILSATYTTYLIFKMANRLANERAAWYASLIFTSSIYVFIIAGTFILPDSPQLLFWVLGMSYLAKAFRRNKIRHFEEQSMLGAGIAIGFALLSKYTSLFLWVGALLYILIYNRKWITNRYLYYAMGVSFVLFLPTLLWNYVYDFTSFGFHTDRMTFGSFDICWNCFLQEVVGEILYNNPLVWIMVILMLFFALTRRGCGEPNIRKFLLLTGIPFILIFWTISLFRPTLPHWTGPAYVTLIPLVGVWMDYVQRKDNTNRTVPIWVAVAVFVLFSGVAFSYLQIKTGILQLDSNTGVVNKGEDDFSLDLYGWEQLHDGFEEVLEQHPDLAVTDKMLSYRWFPAANIDYYVARPLKMKMFLYGKLTKAHSYAWINENRGGIQLHDNFWFITNSRDFYNPEQYSAYFQQILPVDTIPVVRNGKEVMYHLVYMLHDLVRYPINPMDEVNRNEEKLRGIVTSQE